MAGGAAVAVALGMAPVQALADDYGDQATTLPEVMIQARRITESQQHTPVAVTSLDTAVLRLDTVTQVADLQNNVPNFEVAPSQFGGDAAPVYTIRGFSPATDLTDPAVVGYFDGVAVDSRNYGYSMYDLDSVQVLKGPQGTLFGRNSTGGAVLFQPTRPGSAYGGYLDFRAGSLNDREFIGAVDLPVSSQLKIRIAGEREQRDGSLKSVTGGFAYNNRDHGSIRFEADWKPNDLFDNYLQATTYSVREINNVPILQHVGGCFSPFPFTGAGQCYFEFPATFFLGTTDIQAEAAAQQGLGRDHTINATPAPFHVQYNGVTDTMQFHLGEFFIRNIFHADSANYLIGTDFDGSNAPIVGEQDSQHNRYYTDEFQFIGKSLDNRLDWIVGFYYADLEQHQSQFFQQLDFPGNPLGEVFVNDTLPQKSQAIYAHVNMDLGKWVQGLSLSGGYRYTWDRKSFTDQRLAPGLMGPPYFLPSPCAFPIFALPFNPATCSRHLSAKWQDDTWDVSLNWQANPTTLVYVAARKGYEAGGFNFIADNPAFVTYQPEEVRDVEVGLKADWNLGPIPARTNLALYTADYTDIQISTIDFSGPIPQVLIENTDLLGRSNRATMSGGELEVTLLPTPDLSLGGFFGYAQGKYDQFIALGGLGPVDLKGQNISGIIPVTAGLRLTWSPVLPGNWGRPTFGAVVYHQNTQTTNSISANTLGQQGFTDVDLRLDWRGIGGSPVDLAVYGKNVGNERHITFGNDLSGLADVRAVEYSPATSWGLELRYHFGAGR
jgi:iron complex outermembrane receptor protein